MRILICEIEPCGVKGCADDGRAARRAPEVGARVAQSPTRDSEGTAVSRGGARACENTGRSILVLFPPTLPRADAGGRMLPDPIINGGGQG